MGGGLRNRNKGKVSFYRGALQSPDLTGEDEGQTDRWDIWKVGGVTFPVGRGVMASL